MPNSTCDFASLFASANDGEAVTIAVHATRATTGTFIGVSQPLYRTPRTNRSKPYATADVRNRPYFARCPAAIYETRSVCPRTSSARARGYNRGQGGRAPRLRVRCGHDRSARLRLPLPSSPLVLARGGRLAAPG